MSIGPNGHGRKPPPMAGAVDLDALRNRAENRQAIAQAAHQLLRDQGLICECGEPIRDQGIELWLIVEAPNPAGGVQVGIGAATFHSRNCAALERVLTAERDESSPARPVCLRPASPIDWLDETLLSLGEEPAG